MYNSKIQIPYSEQSEPSEKMFDKKLHKNKNHSCSPNHSEYIPMTGNLLAPFNSYSMSYKHVKPHGEHLPI